MKTICTHITLWLFILFISGCELKEGYDTSPRKNFEALWQTIDENYCFFEYKKIDWKDIYKEFAPQIEEEMDEHALFYVLSEMINRLKDGHVNLTTPFSISSYEGWWLDDPFSFDFYTIQHYYLDNDYSYIEDVLYYKSIENGQIGYIHYKSFSESVLEKELDTMFKQFENCSALIIDIRDNTGGSLTNSDRLASRFFHRKTLTGYISHKTGKGHKAFSNPYPVHLLPSHSTLWPEEKPIVVLTNRKCYSAANNFVSKMNVLPNVTLIGIETGGGSGFPFTSELPNGWGIRFSTSPILDINFNHTEFGIKPDIYVEYEAREEYPGIPKDPILERAITFLLRKE